MSLLCDLSSLAKYRPQTSDQPSGQSNTSTLQSTQQIEQHPQNDTANDAVLTILKDSFGMKIKPCKYASRDVRGNCSKFYISGDEKLFDKSIDVIKGKLTCGFQCESCKGYICYDCSIDRTFAPKDVEPSCLCFDCVDQGTMNGSTFDLKQMVCPFCKEPVLYDTKYSGAVCKTCKIHLKLADLPSFK